MPLHSLARNRGELFSPHHTWDEPGHPAVEAIPVLSDGKGENWYYRTAVRVGGDWIQLKDEFCLFLFPVPKVIPRRI